jgi:hypothetical protein
MTDESTPELFAESIAVVDDLLTPVAAITFVFLKKCF